MKLFKSLGAAILSAALLLVASFEAPAQNSSSPYQLAPQQPNFYRTDTNAFPLSITNNGVTVTVTNGLKLTVRQDTGLSFFVGTLSTNGLQTNSATIYFDVSYDGTNFTTTRPLSVTAPINGTNAALYWTNIPAPVYNGIDSFRALTVSAVSIAGSGTTNVNSITKLVYSYSGQ